MVRLRRTPSWSLSLSNVLMVLGGIFLLESMEVSSWNGRRSSSVSPNGGWSSLSSTDEEEASATDLDILDDDDYIIHDEYDHYYDEDWVDEEDDDDVDESYDEDADFVVGNNHPLDNKGIDTNDDGLLDEEAEAVLLALQRSEEMEDRAKRSAKKRRSVSLKTLEKKSESTAPARVLKSQRLHTEQHIHEGPTPKKDLADPVKTAVVKPAKFSQRIVSQGDSTSGRQQALSSLGRAQSQSPAKPKQSLTISSSALLSSSSSLSSQRTGRKTQVISSPTRPSNTTPWIQEFLAQRANDRLLSVPKEYISDNFNLAQLPPIIEHIGYQAMGQDAVNVAKALQECRRRRQAAVASATTAGALSTSPPTSVLLSAYPIYKSALRLILSENQETNTIDMDDCDLIPYYARQAAAEALYMLIHARYALSPRGLEVSRQLIMKDRTRFGKCPRPMCRGTGMLPYGYSNDFDVCDRILQEPRYESSDDTSSPAASNMCHRYCPSCGEVWIAWDSRTNGCVWGPSWCHLFLLTHGTQVYAAELKAAAVANAHKKAVGQALGDALPTAPARSFLPRRLHGYLYGTSTAAAATGNAPTNSVPNEKSLSSPAPSVYGFRIHPATVFGRPWSEQLSVNPRGGGNINITTDSNNS